MTELHNSKWQCFFYIRFNGPLHSCSLVIMWACYTVLCFSEQPWTLNSWGFHGLEVSSFLGAEQSRVLDSIADFVCQDLFFAMTENYFSMGVSFGLSKTNYCGRKSKFPFFCASAECSFPTQRTNSSATDTGINRMKCDVSWNIFRWQKLAVILLYFFSPPIKAILIFGAWLWKLWDKQKADCVSCLCQLCWKAYSFH